MDADFSIEGKTQIAFFKFKVEGDEGAVKIKNTGQSFEQIVSLLQQKISSLRQSFELIYQDQDDEFVSMKDDIDWKLFVESGLENAVNKGLTGPQTLAVKIIHKSEQTQEIL